MFIHLPQPRQAITFLGAVVLSARGIFIPGLNVAPTAAAVAGAALMAGIVLGLVFALLPRRSLAAREVLPKLAHAGLIGGIVVAAAALWLGRTPDMPLVQVAELRGLNFRGGIRIAPEFAALLTGMSLYGGAFIGEIVRAGFLSVGKGQVEAAQALGLGPVQVLVRVRLPLALRMALPTLTNQYVWLLKATTLGIAVGFVDLFLVISTSIIQSGQTLELLGIMMAGFLIMNNLLAAVMNFIISQLSISFMEVALVMIVGIFDFLASGNAAYGAGEWSFANVEVYAFIALVYFVFVFCLSRYGAYLERRMRVGK